MFPVRGEAGGGHVSCLFCVRSLRCWWRPWRRRYRCGSRGCCSCRGCGCSSGCRSECSRCSWSWAGPLLCPCFYFHQSGVIVRASIY
jgi:hypothetical protein